MDRNLCTLNRGENHHLEQVPCTIRPDDKPAVWVLSGILDGERMVNSVADFFVGDAVLASRQMDLHEDLVYYEILRTFESCRAYERGRRAGRLGEARGGDAPDAGPGAGKVAEPTSVVEGRWVAPGAKETPSAYRA